MKKSIPFSLSEAGIVRIEREKRLIYRSVRFPRLLWSRFVMAPVDPCLKVSFKGKAF